MGRDTVRGVLCALFLGATVAWPRLTFAQAAPGGGSSRGAFPETAPAARSAPAPQPGAPAPASPAPDAVPVPGASSATGPAAAVPSAPPPTAPAPGVAPGPAPASTVYVVPNAYAAPPNVYSPAPPAQTATPERRLPNCEHGAPSPCVQPPDAYLHDGFYLRFGMESGYMSFFGDGTSGSASVSGASSGALLALGGNVAEGLVIGGVIHTVATRATFNGVPNGPPELKATVMASELGVLLDWFPNAAEGWHVGGILGLQSLAVTDAQVSDATGFGVGGSVLGGYDWWIGPQWSLGLLAVFSGTSSASLYTTKDHDDTGYRFKALSAGLEWAITLH